MNPFVGGMRLSCIKQVHFRPRASGTPPNGPFVTHCLQRRAKAGPEAGTVVPLHTGAMVTRTPADLAKEVHRQFTVLRDGRVAAAEYAKALDDVHVVPLVDQNGAELLQLESPAELGSRLVAVLFGQAGSTPAPSSLPAPDVRPAGLEDWQEAAGKNS